MSGLPKGWAHTSLGAIIELKYGKSLPKGDRKEGPYNVYGSNGIVGTNQSSLSFAPAIIVGRKGSFGEVTYSAEKCFPIDTTYYVDEFDVVEPRFCYSLLQYLPLKSLNRATAIPGLNREDAYGLMFALPPLAEQKRIVAKLDALNEKSARTRTALARIETLVSRYKQAVLGKAFSGELTGDWRNELLQVDAWRKSLVGSECEIRLGKMLDKVKNKGEPTLYLRNINVRWGNFDLSDILSMNMTSDERAKLDIKDGDVLVCEGGEPGRCAVWSLGPTNISFQKALMRVRPKLDLTSHFFFYFMRWAANENLLTQHFTGTTIKHLPQAALSKVPISVPPLEEQHEIVRRIESAVARIDRLAAEAKRALALVGRLDEAVLAKAFRGELVPQDENDEPASSLLDRIREARTSEPSRPKRRASATKGKVHDMARTMIEALSEAKDWLAAQELFASCGVRDGSSTEDVEKLYSQLLDLDRQDRVEIEEVSDPLTGAKLGNRVRLRK